MHGEPGNSRRSPASSSAVPQSPSGPGLGGLMNRGSALMFPGPLAGGAPSFTQENCTSDTTPLSSLGVLFQAMTSAIVGVLWSKLWIAPPGYPSTVDRLPLNVHAAMRGLEK